MRYYSFKYNEFGNITSKTLKHNGSLDEIYEYDTRQRLIHIKNYLGYEEYFIYDDDEEDFLYYYNSKGVEEIYEKYDNHSYVHHKSRFGKVKIEFIKEY